MSEDDIRDFVVELAEFLDELLSKKFFDDDEKYSNLTEFCLDYFEEFYTKDRNYN